MDTLSSARYCGLGNPPLAVWPEPVEAPGPLMLAMAIIWPSAFGMWQNVQEVCGVAPPKLEEAAHSRYVVCSNDCCTQGSTVGSYNPFASGFTGGQGLFVPG